MYEKIFGTEDSGTWGVKDLGNRSLWESGIQGVQGIGDFGNRRFGDSGIWGFGDSGIRRLRDSGINTAVCSSWPKRPRTIISSTNKVSFAFIVLIAVSLIESTRFFIGTAFSIIALCTITNFTQNTIFDKYLAEVLQTEPIKIQGRFNKYISVKTLKFQVFL